jgi:hypothetical protein
MTNWTLDELHTNLRKAEALARKWIRLTPHSIIPAYDIIYTNDGPVLNLNDVVTSWCYVPKPGCPKWLQEYVKGRYYTPNNDDITRERESVQKGMAIAHITGRILVKWGFDGYVQTRLPF